MPRLLDNRRSLAIDLSDGFLRRIEILLLILINAFIALLRFNALIFLWRLSTPSRIGIV